MARNGEIVNENGNGEWPQIVEVEADSLWNCTIRELQQKPLLQLPLSIMRRDVDPKFNLEIKFFTELEIKFSTSLSCKM